MANELKMAIVESILQLHTLHWSARRIAWHLDIDRGTVRKYLKEALSGPKPAIPPAGSDGSKPATPPPAPGGSAPAADHADFAAPAANSKAEKVKAEKVSGTVSLRLRAAWDVKRLSRKPHRAWRGKPSSLSSQRFLTPFPRSDDADCLRNMEIVDGIAAAGGSYCTGLESCGSTSMHHNRPLHATVPTH
jgi:hypothetical protein